MRDLNKEIDGGEFLLNVFKWIFYIVLFWGIFYGYFVVYNPKKQNYIKKSNYAFQEIQKEVTDLYKQQGYIYTSIQDKEDALCKIMNRKNSKGGGSCYETNTFVLNKNFTLNKTKVDILGMEKAPYEYEGMIVKDVMIDIDGENKGENQIGVDRVPIKIYSDGRMAGKITPVSCSMTTTKDWEVPYPNICKGAPEIDFMQNNEPFGFDVIQVGGENGKSRVIGRNIPFFRADCVAFGGEMIAPIGYCDQRQYYWLPACYDEYPCSVELSTSKF